MCRCFAKKERGLQTPFSVLLAGVATRLPRIFQISRTKDEGEEKNDTENCHNGYPFQNCFCGGLYIPSSIWYYHYSAV